MTKKSKRRNIPIVEGEEGMRFDKLVQFKLALFDAIQDNRPGSRALRFMLATRLVTTKNFAEILSVTSGRISQFYIGAEPVPVATRKRVAELLEIFVQSLKDMDPKVIQPMPHINVGDGVRDWITDALLDSWITIGDRLIEEEHAALEDSSV